VNRILSAAAAAALGLSLFTACGDEDGGGSASDDGGDYCTDLKAAQKTIGSLGAGDLSSLSDAADQVHELRDEAPDEIEDDWKVLSDGFDKILTAFEKAGLTEEDIAKLQSGQMPEDVDMEAITEAMKEFEELGAEEFTKAGDAIRTHAKDECGIELKA